MRLLCVPIVLLVWSWTEAANAVDIVTRCGGSEGYTYFVEGGAVPKGKGGWQQDRTSKGSYLLVRDRERNQFDLIFSDAMDRTVSSREHGAQILVASETEKTIVLLMNYRDVLLEMWVFDLDTSGRGTVTFHQARYGSEVPIRKHGIQRASCKK